MVTSPYVMHRETRPFVPAPNWADPPLPKSADGQSFLMVKDESSSGRLNLVVNFTDELARRVAK